MTEGAPPDPLGGARVAVLGFGHQGEAQALRLRGNGVRVVVGARPGGRGAARATELGFVTLSLADAARSAEWAVVLLPDEVLPQAWPELCPALEPARALVFAHGFNLLYSDLRMPARGDVVLVSPTAPGTALTAARGSDATIPAYLAVHQNPSGGAWEVAERYARAIGCAPTWRTTVRDETEIDLFGEQAVLCGGMNALTRAAFETLVAAGYAPEMAYLECVHQLAYLAELLRARGMRGMRAAISGTALYGDLTRGPRVIGSESRAAMRAMLEEIRSGAFTREWRAESEASRPRLAAALAPGADPLESARARALGAAPGVAAPEPTGRG